MNVTITSTQKLTLLQLNKLKNAIKKKHGSQINFAQKIDQSVIGGVKITLDSTEIDATVSGKLRRIYQELSSKL